MHTASPMKESSEMRKMAARNVPKNIQARVNGYDSLNVSISLQLLASTPFVKLKIKYKKQKQKLEKVISEKSS